MEARLYRIILQHVDKALHAEPSRKPLLNLLQISDPELTEKDVLDTKKREAAFRSFKLLIHPDKHRGDTNAATTRFQKAQTFYDDCVRHISRKRSYSTSPRSNTLPLQFHIHEKWPFLAKMNSHPIPPSKTTVESEMMEKIIAYKCINFRGSIAHGKKPELRYTYNQVLDMSANDHSAYDVFNGFGGCKRLVSVEEIKEEIMNHGPVVSSSFELTQALLNAGDHAHAFDAALVDHTHAVLIVGWKQTAYGEVWIVRASKGTTDIPISMGQYGMEDTVCAPCSDFMDRPWQDDSKIYDIPNFPSDWYAWTRFSTECKSVRIETLFKNLGCTWATALKSKTPFVVRESQRKARSRYAYLIDIEWAEDKKMWKLQAKFCDQKWED